MNNRLFVSVIIPVYNGGKFLPRCLDAIFASDYQAFEIIVVDDGSTDESERVGREKGAIVLSTERPQSGPAAARNLAAKTATGEILVFIDADVVVRRDTISKIVDRFQKRSEIAALFGSYDDAPGEPNFLSQYRNLLHHFVHQNSKGEASTFWAGLGAVRRDVFLAVGGFDSEKFPLPSIEDIEFGTRLRARGHRILLDKNIQAKHLKRWSAASVLRTDIFRRALPWSKLILTNRGMINDMNLKTNDRLSAALVGLTVLIFPFVFLKPILIVLPLAFLLAVLFLNRKIFRFFVRKKGVVFAALAFAWQLLYFFYSGATFVLCWLRYALLPAIIGFKERREIRSAR